MSWSQQDFVDALNQDLGDQLLDLLEEDSVYRWINDAKDRLGPRSAKTTTVTWSVGDTTVALPTDFKRLDEIRMAPESCREPMKVHGRNLVFKDVDGAVVAGSAAVDYWANYADVTEDDDFEGEESECLAIVSYLLHRFYLWLLSSRVNYRRYSTITGSNATRFEDLAEVSNSHLADFAEARAISELADPVTYYGD